jgi:predicted kinase
MTKPQFICLVGLPGSGKSTWMRSFLSKNSNYVVISSDDIIEEKCNVAGIAYSEGFDKFIGYATSEMKRRFNEAISNKLNIILDQTNMSIKSRRSKMNNLSDDYEKTAMIFVVPDPVLKERLDHRAKTTGKVIPEFVMNSMARSYEMPTKNEGFDHIHYVR